MSYTVLKLMSVHVGETGVKWTTRLLVEDCDGTSHANDDQRLASKEGEHDRAQDGCQEHLVDSILHIRLGEHVQGEGQGGQNTEEALSARWNVAMTTRP